MILRAAVARKGEKMEKAIEMLLDLICVDPERVEQINETTVRVTVRFVLEGNFKEFLWRDLSAEDGPQVNLKKLINLHDEVDASHAEWRRPSIGETHD